MEQFRLEMDHDKAVKLFLNKLDEKKLFQMH